MAKVVIFGAGDIAKLAYYYFTHDSNHDIVAFAVDRQHHKSETFLGLPLIDFEQITRRYPPDAFKMFVALSYAKMNKIRAEKYYRAKELGYKLVNYVSSRCSFLTQEPIGENCFILEDNTIQPFVKISNNVTLWSGNHIGHDSIIDDHCFITSHVVVSGHVHIRECCFLGVNSTVRNSITLAPETLVGAGAVVMEDTVERGVYVPQRASLIGKKSNEIEL